MKRHKILRAISCALIVALTINTLPMDSVRAAGTEGSVTEPPATVQAAGDGLATEELGPVQLTTDQVRPVQVSSDQVNSEATVLGEVETLRQEGIKHFRMSDGSFVAVDYGMPVHFKDSQGDWQDIDNSLTLTTDKAGTATYRTITKDTDQAPGLGFAGSLAAGELFTANYQDVSVTMSLLDTSRALELAAAGQQVQTAAEAVSPEGTRLWAGEEQPLSLTTYSRSAQVSLVSQAETKETGIQAPGQEFMPEKLRSTLLYEDVYPGVDLEYTAYGYNVKEQIIVREKQQSYRYDFLLELEGLEGVLETDGSVSLYNEKQELIYRIPAPYMVDDGGRISLEVRYSLTDTSQGMVLTLEADKEWINSSDRVLPVKIDPTLELRPTNMYDSLAATYVEECYGNLAIGGTDLVFTGAWSDTEQSSMSRNRAFLHFKQLPVLPAGCQVVDARLHLFLLAYTKTPLEGLDSMNTPVGLYEVTGEKPAGYSTYDQWIGSIHWNNQPAYNGGNVIDYVITDYNLSTYHEWDMSETVKKWYSTGTGNTTIALVCMNEGSMTAQSNAQVGFSLYEYAPYFWVSYRSEVGMEPYYTYTDVGAGNAGTGYIADHTGQLKVVKEVASYASSVNPFSLNLVYNSDYFTRSTAACHPAQQMGLTMKVGNGWTLDALQYMVPQTITNHSYVRYRDGDGTDHYFLINYWGGRYYDEDGLGLVVEKIDDTTFEMWDDEGHLWKFTNNMLTSYMDNHRTKTEEGLEEDGNQYLYSYTTDKKLSRIQQKNRGSSAITVASFAYDSSGYLTKITDAAGVETLFSYDGNGDLISITKAGQVLASYTYQNHRLTKLKDEGTGYAINLAYQNGRVSSYQESGGDTPGAKCGITYANSSKTIYHDYGRDLAAGGGDDVYTYCLFDYWGRTVNLYSTDSLMSEENLTEGVLGAASAVYTATASPQSIEDDITYTFRKNNRISRSAKVGVISQQQMEDHGFEKGASGTAWTLATTGQSGVGAAINQTKKRTGYYAFQGYVPAGTGEAGVSASRLSRVLNAGETYTFSAYVSTTQATAFLGEGMYLEVRKGDTSLGKSRAVNYATSGMVEGGWIRLSVTFTPAVTGAHTLRICSDGVEGYVYADDCQLEKGQAPSSVNLLENGDMDGGTTGWNLTGGGSYSAAAGALRMGSATTPTPAYARFDRSVMINLPATETFVLSGWVRAKSVPEGPSSAKRTCGLQAFVRYTDGTEEIHEVAFDPDVSDWQFASLSVVPKAPTKTIGSIMVRGVYGRNANLSYFDNLALVRETVQTMAYDSKGNLTKVTATGLGADTATYAEGNLIQSATPGKGTYSYTYGTTYPHRLTKVTLSGMGLSQGYTYDSKGNVKTTTLESSTAGTKKLQSSASYNPDGNRMVSVTDVSGSTASYTYGTLLSQMLGVPR